MITKVLAPTPISASVSAHMMATLFARIHLPSKTKLLALMQLRQWQTLMLRLALRLSNLGTFAIKSAPMQLAFLGPTTAITLIAILVRQLLRQVTQLLSLAHKLRLLTSPLNQK